MKRGEVEATGAQDVLLGGTVLTMNVGMDIFSPGVVAMEAGRIVHTGPAGTWPARPGDRVIDCRDCLVMPGLVNTHTHACTAMFRGLAEDLPRDAWAPHFRLPHQERVRPDDYYWGAMLGGLEMLLNGITCTADRFSHMSIIAEAMDRIGIRAILCHTLFDIDRPLDWDLAVTLMDRWGVAPAGRVHAGLGPHAPDTCSDALLQRVVRCARETGARLFIHVAQSTVELASLRARGYGGAVRCLAANGLLGPNVVAAHCLYVDDEEIGMLADTGTWVAHCPVSNAKIEARIAPVAAMRRAGVRIALGTDWAPTNNGMDLFDEMKNAGLLAKVAAADPTVLPVEELVQMATIGGARALGIEQQVGSLEAGKRADIIALAMDGLHLQPWHNIAANLVYSAKGHDVRHVWVDGRWLIRDRRLQQADANEVREQVQAIWRRLKTG